MSNLALLTHQAYFVPLMNHVIQVVSYSARDDYGTRITNPATSRQYRCLLQQNEDTSWNVAASVDALPYIAYVLSTPINGTDAVPIRAEEQMTIIAPSYWASATPRRLGTVKSYNDQYGNLFCYSVTFE